MQRLAVQVLKDVYPNTWRITEINKKKKIIKKKPRAINHSLLLFLLTGKIIKL